MSVFVSHISKSDSSGSLLVHELTESCFSLHEAVRNVLLSAEGWQVENKLNWINIMGNHNKLGFSVLDKSGDVVKTEFGKFRLWSVFLGTTRFSLFLESLGLLFLGLSFILGEEFEEFMSLVSLEGLGELGNLRRDLQSSHEDSLLSLKSHVLGPFNESRQVDLRSDISSDSIVSRSLLEESTVRTIARFLRT